MAKDVAAIFLLLLLPMSQSAGAARYDRRCEEVSPVLFQKRLKALVQDLRQEMGEEASPEQGEAEELARLAECGAEPGKAPVTGGQRAPRPEEKPAASPNGC
ncbi:hypothetical protein [Serratia entomophila]|jgi:cytochrome c-type biogenesis protein CcmH/NrfG|uniref:hypothetical protein n=1 Tax=Serratia entomophila TaxID=42906 RepID=UPI002177A7EF|nr:hypothetical protein [Serratia entomophila]CAI0874465.1 Uncharacterised protein [Serratia entomophila]CAI1511841.1 Uncharacterised protein [Serratia entomophila]CAI1593494.1 Uncharacterised protein [Serratia entomophila]CAI1824895.1 Uncharacterised protein [Serratia entomophila]CAI1886826.1 Uncharacterised protein [Serratia entomophila]